MKYIINTFHSATDAFKTPDIPNVKFHFGIVQRNPHVLLLFLISAKNDNFLNRCIQKTIQNRVAKRPSTAGDHENFIIKHLISRLFKK
ncbi:hypothetical protein D3C80_1805940 [compost metagenome]